MNFLSFVTPANAKTWGVSQGGTVYDLGPTGLNLASSLRESIENGIFGNISEDQLSGAPTFPESDITFLPAIPDPAKVLCIGVNYRSHQKETGKAVHTKEQKAPTVFFRFPDSQLGHGQPARKPDFTDKFDYEGEMAVVIGKDAWQVSQDEALDYVAGYAGYNDFTVRDWQMATTQWGPGKTFPQTGGFGPYLVPTSAAPDLGSMVLETRVNGEVRQKAPLSDLVFTIPELIEYISTFTPLKAGDVIVSGTPGGVGMFSDPQALLNEGDTVEVEITGLGVLNNTVKEFA